MDRIDLRVQVDPLSRVELCKPELGQTSATIKERVVSARSVASARFAQEKWSLNSEIPSRALRTKYQPERAAMNFLHSELDLERITARGLHKVMRTAWSIADMAGHAQPCLEDAQIAYSLREGSSS